MESIKRSGWLEGFMNRKPHQTEVKKDQKPPEITSINSHKRKRKFIDDEFETALTNGRSTIFETKTQRETRKSYNLPNNNGRETDVNRFVAGHYGLSNAKTKEEANKNINNRIRNQYQRKIAHIENLGKTSRALENIMPKIETLIENDESSTNLANKLYSGEYNSSRRNTGYVCSPLLSIFSREVIPEKLQKDIQHASNENEDDVISGMIPEINLAYIISDKSFNYWSIGTKSTRPMVLELEEKINSVGLVKPPPEYFSSLKCDHILVLGADDYLF